MALPPITRGKRKNPPSICCQLTGWPIRGSHSSDSFLKKSPIGLAFSFKSFCRVFEKEPCSGPTSNAGRAAGLDGVMETAAGGARRLNRALTERTKRPLESPKNMLRTIPRTNRNRYGFRYGIPNAQIFLSSFTTSY